MWRDGGDVSITASQSQIGSPSAIEKGNNALYLSAILKICAFCVSTKENLIINNSSNLSNFLRLSHPHLKMWKTFTTHSQLSRIYPANKKNFLFHQFSRQFPSPFDPCPRNFLIVRIAIFQGIAALSARRVSQVEQKKTYSPSRSFFKNTRVCTLKQKKNTQKISFAFGEEHFFKCEILVNISRLFSTPVFFFFYFPPTLCSSSHRIDSF